MIKPAQAVSTPTFILNPWVYDAQKICPGIEAGWKYSSEENSPSLFLVKPCLTLTPSSTGATIGGMNVQPLTKLGFDLKKDGYCDHASPRYTVYTNEGTYYFPGCRAKSINDLKNGWNRIKFSNSDAQPINDSKPWPGFGRVIVTDVELVFDEYGSTQIDNLQINEQTLTGPTTDQQIESCKKDGWLNYATPKPFKSEQDCIDFFIRNNL